MNGKLSQVSTMAVTPTVVQRLIAVIAGFTAGALIWVLAQQIYAKAEEDEGISVTGCEQSLGMDPLECA
jgi:hypothetical protein